MSSHHLGSGLRRTVFLAGAALSLLPAAAWCTPPKALPNGWSFGEAATEPNGKPRWTYRNPIDRRGTYMHGASGEMGSSEGWDHHAALESCQAKTGRFHGWSDLPAEEYWYFEADGEGLLLLRSREYSGLDANCSLVIRVTDTVERVVIGKHGFTRFTVKDGLWSAGTHHFAAYRRTDLNDLAIGNGFPRMAYFAVRKRRLGDSNVGSRIGKHQTHCVGYSSPPDAGGTLCWLAGSGPGRGIVTYDMQFIAGGPFYHHQITEVEDGVMLDGRLFEWDRPITGLSSAVKPPSSPAASGAAGVRYSRWAAPRP